MKIKLNRYDLTILINGLNTMREKYSQKANEYLCDLILRLIDIYDNTKPKRKARMVFLIIRNMCNMLPNRPAKAV